MEHTNVNLKDMESSASGDSDKGSCTEAPQIGATGRDPVEQGVGETPLIGGGGTPASQQFQSGEHRGPDREGWHSRPPSHQQELLWCCQKVGKEG